VAKLTIFKNGQSVNTHLLDQGAYRIGRDAGNHIVLDDKKVSRLHVTIEIKDAMMLVKDSGSRNQFLFQGEITSYAEIGPGQSFIIRPYEILYEAENTPDQKDKLSDHGSSSDDKKTTVIQVMPRGPGNLVIKNTESTGQEVFPLKSGMNIIGRSSECDIQISNPTVSKRHASIEHLPDRVIIRDLGSKSGTFVNNKQITEQDLRFGDFFRLGAVSIRYQSEAAPLSSAKGVAKNTIGSSGRQDKSQKKTPRTYRVGFIVAACLTFVVLAFIVFYISQANRFQEEKIVQETIAMNKKIQEDQFRKMAAIHLSRGKQAISSGAYTEASDLFRKVLAVNPNNEEAKGLLKQVNTALIKAEESRQKTEREQKAREQKIHDILSMAEKAYGTKNYDAALKLSRDVLLLEPGSNKAKKIISMIEKISLESERKRKDERDRKLQVEIQAKRYHESGMTKKNQGDAIEAIRLWQEIEKIDPSGQTAYLASAKQLIEETKRKLRSQSESIVSQARTSMSAGRYEQSFAFLKEAVRIDPWNEVARSLYNDMKSQFLKRGKQMYDDGVLLESLGELNDACVRWKQALKIVPRDEPLFLKVREKNRNCN